MLCWKLQQAHIHRAPGIAIIDIVRNEIELPQWSNFRGALHWNSVSRGFVVVASPASTPLEVQHGSRRLPRRPSGLRPHLHVAQALAALQPFPLVVERFLERVGGDIGRWMRSLASRCHFGSWPLALGPRTLVVTLRLF